MPISNIPAHFHDNYNYYPGKPRSPIFSSEMREILSGVGAVNISWSCDSFYPVTQYYLHYRQYKVSPARTMRESTNYFKLLKYFLNEELS